MSAQTDLPPGARAAAPLRTGRLHQQQPSASFGVCGNVRADRRLWTGIPDQDQHLPGIAQQPQPHGRRRSESSGRVQGVGDQFGYNQLDVVGQGPQTPFLDHEPRVQSCAGHSAGRCPEFKEIPQRPLVISGRCSAWGGRTGTGARLLPGRAELARPRGQCRFRLQRHEKRLPGIVAHTHSCRRPWVNHPSSDLN